MTNTQTLSAGLAFMHAAAAAAAKTAGDREQVRALKDAMEVAIRNCFEFSTTDGAALLSLAMETRWGDFRPLDYYREGCLAGGAYPEMWEAHHHMQPWVARKAIISKDGLRDFRIHDDHRVAPGMGVLMPDSFDTPVDGTLPIHDMQVWWVNAITDELIRVCRYRLTPEELANRNLDTAFQHHSRSPLRVRTLLREEWDELNAASPVEQQAA
jgi:hypothetical protein